MLPQNRFSQWAQAFQPGWLEMEKGFITGYLRSAPFIELAGTRLHREFCLKVFTALSAGQQSLARWRKRRGLLRNVGITRSSVVHLGHVSLLIAPTMNQICRTKFNLLRTVGHVKLHAYEG